MNATYTIRGVTIETATVEAAILEIARQVGFSGELADLKSVIKTRNALDWEPNIHIGLSFYEKNQRQRSLPPFRDTVAHVAQACAETLRIV